MTDSALEDNLFYRHIKRNEKQLSAWCEPLWRVCVPCDAALSGRDFTAQFTESHALQETTAGVYESVGCGGAVVYRMDGNVLLCRRLRRHVPPPLLSSSHCSGGGGDDEEAGEGRAVQETRVTIVAEYLITVLGAVVHLLLLESSLDPTAEEEELLLPLLPSITITTSTQAAAFLGRCSCHAPVLTVLEAAATAWCAGVDWSAAGAEDIVGSVHGLLLDAWEAALGRHGAALRDSVMFQDLLYTALDFVTVGACHETLWWWVRRRCGVMDDLVARHLAHLRTASATNSPHSLHHLPTAFTPAPAAVVEMAALGTHGSAVARVHALHAAEQLLHADAKHARAELCTYAGTVSVGEAMTAAELVTLLMLVLAEAQCEQLVSNLYYTTHYAFSLPDDHPARQSVVLVKRALQQMMQEDALPPPSSPVTVTPLRRRELSLHDLMEISSAVEQRFERPRSSHGSGRPAAAAGGGGGCSGGGSDSDVSNLDLHWHHLTHKIHLSTMDNSSSSSLASSSPALRPTPPRASSSLQSLLASPPLPAHMHGLASSPPPLSPHTSQGLITSFMDLLSSLPASARESLRRQQAARRPTAQSQSQDTPLPS